MSKKEFSIFMNRLSELKSEPAPEPPAPAPVNVAIQFAYAKGYEDAIDKIKEIIRQECQKRASELPDTTAKAHTAFTRDRVLWAIAPLAEKVAVKRMSLERQLSSANDDGHAESDERPIRRPL